MTAAKKRRKPPVQLAQSAQVPSPVSLKEQTGAQSVGMAWGSETLANTLPATYATYRTIRKHPTVALARAFCMAPIVAGSWSYEADDDVPDEVVKFLRTQLEPIREPLLQVALEGGCDFGWQAFEKVFGRTREGLIGLRKLKPLIQESTTILVDKTSGQFAGLRQPAQDSLNDRDLGLPYCLLINFRVEGTQWYGTSLLENVRSTYTRWVAANDGAARYDDKLAGSHWVVYYPLGQSPLAGVETDNATIAESLLNALESSGSISIPRQIVKYVDQLNKEQAVDGWEIKALSDSSPRQASFVDRLAYLDKLLVRGVLLPERAVMEGKFGTKAEAGVHADLALVQRELEHRHVTRLINWHLVDQLLALNFGEAARGTVRLVAAPLADHNIAWLREVYKLLLANPATLISMFTGIDVDALTDAVAVPKGQEVIEEPDEPAAPGLDTENELAASVAAIYHRLVA